MNTVDLVAAVKARHGLTSDAALARLLAMSEQTVARWRTGRNWPDDLTAARLAELADFDPAEVVALVHAERARDPQEKALWSAIAGRLATPALVALAAILTLWTSGGPDGGATLAGGLLASLWTTSGQFIDCGVSALVVAAAAYTLQRMRRLTFCPAAPIAA